MADRVPPHAHLAANAARDVASEPVPENEIGDVVFRPWGSYAVLDKGEGFQVKRLSVDPGQALSVQSHRRRAEHWIVVAGQPEVAVDEDRRRRKPGDMIFIPIGARHHLSNPTDRPAVIVEVQRGDYLGEDDIVRHQDRYGRKLDGES